MLTWHAQITRNDRYICDKILPWYYWTTFIIAHKCLLHHIKFFWQDSSLFQLRIDRKVWKVIWRMNSAYFLIHIIWWISETSTGDITRKHPVRIVVICLEVAVEYCIPVRIIFFSIRFFFHFRLGFWLFFKRSGRRMLWPVILVLLF